MLKGGLIMQLLSIKIANDIGYHIMNRFYEYAAKYNIDLDYVTLYIYSYNYNGVPDHARCSNGDNASLKSRIKFFRTFFELEAEKGANDAVGITIDDIIDLEKLKLCR